MLLWKTNSDIRERIVYVILNQEIDTHFVVENVSQPNIRLGITEYEILPFFTKIKSVWKYNVAENCYTQTCPLCAAHSVVLVLVRNTNTAFSLILISSSILHKFYPRCKFQPP